MIGSLNRMLDRRRFRNDDAGLTLVELLVSMVVTSMLFLAVATIFTGTSRAVRVNNNRLNEANNARVAIAAIGKTLRAAVLPSQDDGDGGACSGQCLSAFVQGTDTSITFFSNINNPVLHATSGNNTSGPRRVTYGLTAMGGTTGNALTQLTQVPDLHAWDNFNWTYSACTTAAQNCETRTLATNVAQLGAARIFTYYVSGTQVTGGQPYGFAQLALVDSVDIVLSVQISGGSAGTVPVTYVQRVALPNVDTYIQSQSGS